MCLPPNWNKGHSVDILTDFKQHVEDTEFQTGELIVIEIPIYRLFLKHQKINIHGYEAVATNVKKGRSYHKTITVVFSPCFFQKRNNQGPQSHIIGNDINEFGHRETAGYDGLLQRRSRSHPVATLRPLQSVHDELCHGVRIQSSKNTRRSLLKATFEEMQIEQWVFDQLLLIPAAQEVHICLHKSMGTPLYRHHTNIWTNSVNDAPQRNHLLAHVSTEPIQDCYAHPTELTTVPATQEHPGVLSPLHEFNPAIAMQLCPGEGLLQNSRVHAIEDD